MKGMDRSKVHAHVCVTYMHTIAYNKTTSSENGVVRNAGQFTIQM